MSDETIISARRILILSANPRDTDRLRLDEEVREIQDRLKRAKYGRLFTVQLATAIRIRDLQQELLDHEPDIVHFCGHSKSEGLLLENNLGEAVLVPSDGLASLFALCSQHVECVLLNSCHSRAQAEVISQHIPYVIGMKKEVFDDAAVEFAGGLYAALGAGRNIEESFEFGRNALKLHDLPDELTPILLKQKVVADTPGKTISPQADNTTSSDRPSVSAPVAAKQNLPQRLITARQENKLIPIVGAGVSMSLKDESGERFFPGWDQLLEYAADALKMEGKEDLSDGIRIMLKLKKLQEAADLANDGLTGRLWTEFFRKYIEEPLDRAPDDSFALPKAVWEISNRVITLNYDKVLRIACPNIRRLKELDNSNHAGLADFKTNNDTPMVWHLHGRTDNISTLIFTAESYSRLYAETDKNYQAALDLFKDLCRDNYLLFVGCSLEDAELLQVMAEQHKLFGENTGPHYALVREKYKAEISRKLDGMPLELLTFEDFGEPLLELVQAIAGPEMADLPPPETKEPEVIPEETTAPEEKKEESRPKEKRMALLSANPLDDEQNWKLYLDELGKLACPIDHFSLSIDNLNNLEGYDYLLIISKVVKNKLLIESEYLCSDKISFQDLEDSIGIGQPDGIFIFVDQLPEPESTAELSLPTFILPVENKKHVHKILFQVFRKNNLECCDKSRLLHPAAFDLCPLSGKKGIHREETELSKSISTKALKGFVGRKDDLENICRKLMELEQGDVLTVKGAGGIGKTHTVKKIAVALADRGLFSGGIHFIDCEPVAASGQFRFKAAAVFGLELAEDLWQHLSEHHDDLDRLIIFDNFEPLLYLDEQEDIKEILSRIADYATVMVTSREVLDLEGETVHQMRRLTTDEAVELFNAKFPVPEQQMDLLRQKILSRLLDNNPLAIKLI
ncbi:MAG: CHAT domain-containing protein, partial [Candidatus Electrothrix sp. AX5]|nr:CHAT domain-containing protein [Candidatus Electrothrix sp. AX5]